jgi:UDP-3-O-[3-hydroxymyristoyl] glucosamine N-acyltransferase
MASPVAATTLRELARQVNGRVQGNPDIPVHGVGSLQGAGPGQLSFFVDSRLRAALACSRAAAVVLAPRDAPSCPLPALVVEEPYSAFVRIAEHFQRHDEPEPGIHPAAVVHEHSRIDASASVGPGCVVAADVRIGPGVMVGPHCTIMERARIEAGTRLVAAVTLCPDTSIGERCLIHPGAVIGADGFGLLQEAGKWRKIPQLGRVRIGNDVEIGANTTIDRGALDDTVIDDGVKIDNLVQIAHNVEIGADTAIAGCVGISGSTRIGRRCRLGGGVGLAGHMRIADDVVLTGMTLVTRSIDNAGSYSSGTAAEPTVAWRKNAVRFRQLDAMARRLKRVEEALARLEDQR